ncbi:hypothetical protein E7T09_03995 [Deinococcus sp. KSM4-11]|uniref:hypothetical protein n=1 Tax=Deinococcus sp. KSM4-11 TaxID=2568654 RepID=UPI0010A5315F|nr:hypothetical protein [Deinococcus sp. KSM4-11]THF88375.1 hypothetical protein E7T09_03995 [Deinococcus sp. KSM4-11]
MSLILSGTVTLAEAGVDNSVAAGQQMVLQSSTYDAQGKPVSTPLGTATIGSDLSFKLTVDATALESTLESVPTPVPPTECSGTFEFTDVSTLKLSNHLEFKLVGGAEDGSRLLVRPSTVPASKTDSIYVFEYANGPFSITNVQTCKYPNAKGGIDIYKNTVRVSYHAGWNLHLLTYGMDADGATTFSASDVALPVSYTAYATAGTLSVLPPTP